MTSMTHTIVTIDSGTGARCAPELARLLADAVNEGATVGFLAPLAVADATRYWLSVLERLDRDVRLVVAFDDEGHVVGTGQLLYPWQPNGAHRAEVAKLIVASDCRRQGIGSRILGALVAMARADGRQLLILNTRKDGAPVDFYRRSGFVEVGEIPGYTRDAQGVFEDTVFMYRRLAP